MEGILEHPCQPTSPLHALLEEREHWEKEGARRSILGKPYCFIRSKLALAKLRKHADRAARIGTDISGVSKSELALLQARLARIAGMLCGEKKAAAMRQSLDSLRKSDPDNEIAYLLAEAELHGLMSGSLMERGSYNKAQRLISEEVTEETVSPANHLLYYRALARFEESLGNPGPARSSKGLGDRTLAEHRWLADRMKRDPLFRFLNE